MDRLHVQEPAGPLSERHLARSEPSAPGGITSSPGPAPTAAGPFPDVTEGDSGAATWPNGRAASKTGGPSIFPGVRRT